MPNDAAAVVLDNWVPLATGIRIRGGSYRVASIGDPVVSLFSYRTGGSHSIFAASDTDIYDVTAPADPDVAPTASVTSQTEGYYSTQQIGTAGGNFLYAVNGADEAQLYDGSAWTAINGASTPAITGVGTDDLSQVWLYASRLFFVEQSTTRAWYLDVDSVGGAATSFDLRAIFQKGGSLLFGASWSTSDAGDGLDDRCIFVSDQGEVAVYVGTNPSSASTWAKQGLYKIPKPLGKNAFTRVAGDVLVATVEGLVSIASATTRDAAALSLAAVSAPIEPDWRLEASRRQSIGWEIAKWDEGNLGIITNPTENPESVTPQCFVVNLETGAWSRFTGWDARCVTVVNGTAYFGNNDGRILEVERGGDDDGALYTMQVCYHPETLGSPASHKVALMGRATFISSMAFNPKISVSVNYGREFPSAPPSVTPSDASLWDSAVWDSAVWDGASPAYVRTQWVSLGRDGFAFSPQVQISSGAAVATDAELIAFDMLYQMGGPVV